MSQLPTGVRLRGPLLAGYDEILTPEALDFLAALVRTHAGKLRTLLQLRLDRQASYDRGTLPWLLKSTESVREADWTVAPLPADLHDRRVEITGPVDRKMIINALNSGAKVFMADFEDSTAPTWSNLLDGQINLRDAVRGTISFTAPETGKSYALGPKPAVLLVRPRGLHLPEAHVEIDGQPIPGGLFDFALYFFHNAKALLAKGSGPYFYLPKLEHHAEAKWWNDVFVDAQAALGIPNGTIKATVLIETLPATFQLDEILYALKDHSAGLNCGRWDYIFSYIKCVRNHPEFVLPDRADVTMVQPMMRAYTQRVIQTCHRRNAPAMGGMAAQIPIKDDPAANEAALNKVKADKLREVTDGHDGTWVAHPALVSLAMDIFNEHMTTPNQIDRKREDLKIQEADLLKVPKGPRTLTGLRHNLRVGVQYVAAWIGGLGCVPLYNLMEDAATAEISRAQVWQQIRHGAALDDGTVVTAELVRATLADEVAALNGKTSAVIAAHLDDAAARFFDMLTAAEMPAFLTLPLYPSLLTFNDA